MLNSINLKNNYIKWFNKNITIRQISKNIVKMDMPFLDNFNDEISMYIIQKNDNIIFNDDGWTLDNLQSLGVKLRKNSYKYKLIASKLHVYGVNINKYGELILISDIADVSYDEQKFIQAILFINNMFVFKPKKITNVFSDSMANFFNHYHILTMRNKVIKGASGLNHMYDFVIPGKQSKNKSNPNKYIKAISEANNRIYAGAAFADVIETRPELPDGTYKFYVFLNDIDKNNNKIKINDGIINLFYRNNIKPCLYTQRKSYINDFSA